MRIVSAEFVKSCVRKEELPRDGLPEVAFVGRSNVGKSTLINTITNRKKLAHTSSTPGKTRTINFYLINRRFYFVDLPGYGYAKVSRKERIQWQKMIEGYLKNRPQLKGVLALIDSRRDPDELELALYRYLASLEKRVVTVLTKADKMPRGRLSQRVAAIRKALGVERVIPFSARTGEGKTELLKAISEFVEAD